MSTPTGEEGAREHYHHGGEALGQGKSKPYPFDTQHFRQQQEARHEEDYSAQECKSGGGQYALHTLVVADGGEVQHEEHEACAVVGEALYRHLCGGSRGVEEQRHEPLREEHKQQRRQYAAHDGSLQRHTQSLTDTRGLPQAEVVTDDRLGGLGNGVANHKDEGHVVATDAECAHAVVTEITHKHVITNKEEHCHSHLVEQRGEAHFALFGEVAGEEG